MKYRSFESRLITVRYVVVLFVGIAFAFVNASLVSAQNSKSTARSHRSRTKTSKKATRKLAASTAQNSGKIEISGAAAVKPGVTYTELRKMPQIGPSPAEKDKDNEEIERLAPPMQKKSPLPGAVDPINVDALQPVSPTTPVPSISFDGLDFTNWGSGFPPDTVGDVGPNHYVQAVNSSFAVYNKSGTRLAALTFNTLWTGNGAGTPCASSNRGDPTVIYDPQNNRWVVADFAFTGNGTVAPFYECIAVSQTADPTGNWWLYAYRADDASHPWLADYPKMGIWPDGLYMSANMFLNGTFQEVRLWAFNLSDLVAGAALRNVVIDTNSTAYFSMLPSNYRGTQPPAARENIVVGESSTSFAFNVFKFKPNYTTPASSTFTGPTVVSQASYTSSTGSVPSPVNSLDTVNSDNLKMQNQYRSISGTESVWVHHNTLTAAGGVNGVQWAQIDVTGGTINATPVQQQIYGNLSSDGLHRWMQSLAVDKQGNMLMGYSAGNASTNPSIRYNGRLAGDPLNTLPQGEIVMQTGGGTESGNCGASACTRWGDYSAMSVDPSDDCTFWYTTEYFQANGLAWNTKIGAVKFPGCTSAPTARTQFDFDGDGKADISIFRPAAAQWWISKSSNSAVVAATFGASTDTIVPADYTGDGKTDIAVFRPGTGTWYILRSEDSSFYAFPFGSSTDIPVPADYDGDGKADAAVFRPSTATWYINKSSGGTTITAFGTSTDKPVPADYDGDGKADIAIWRPGPGEWWYMKSSNGVVSAAQFGSSTDKAVPGDYTGDGKADFAFFRPSTGTWFVLRSENFSYYSFPFGTSTDTPAPGDYDGDGKMDAGVFRSSTNTWYLNRSTAGVLIQGFGAAGDVAVPNSYVR